MPQTKVRAPDGRIITVQHPEGASERAIIAFAQNPGEYDPSSQEFKDRYGPVTPASYKLPPQSELDTMSAQQLAEQYSNLPAFTPAGQFRDLASGAGKFLSDPFLGIKQMFGQAPASAATDKAALDAPLMESSAGKVGYVGGGMAFTAPTALIPGANTVTGSALIGGGLGLLQPAASTADRAINTAAGAGIAAGGQLVANGIARTLAQKRAPSPRVSSNSELSAESIATTGERLVSNTFRSFRDKVGANTQAPLNNTAAAIRTAVDDLVKQGKGKSAFAKELRAVLAQNPQGTTSISILDDIASNNMTRISMGHNPKQARLVLEGVIADMDAAGRSVGLTFADDLGVARAFGELYKGNNLGRVVGQYGKTINAYKTADPDGFQEIITDWTGKKLETFVRTNAAGGREFSTARFGQWVAENESHLNQLVGAETVGVWKAFPAWQGRASFLKGMGQRFLEAKTGGLSSFFNKEIDMKFAEGVAQMLTDPNSPLYQALKRGPGAAAPFPFPVLMLGAEAANGTDERQP